MSQTKKALPEADQLTLLEVRNYKVVKSNELVQNSSFQLKNKR